jgi:RNA polymerase sigma-70 factor (ECF subfamily)
MKITENQAAHLPIIAERFRTKIFGYIRSKVADKATAEDLTQETFVKVGNALAKGTEPEHFRGWLFQIARNTIIDFLKEADRFVSLEKSQIASMTQDPEILDPVDNAFRKQLFSYALKVIETLPPEDCQALTLTELDGLSREELAGELGISLTAAKSRVHRARGKLRKAVEECCRLVTDPYGRVIDWKKRQSPPCGPKSLRPGSKREVESPATTKGSGHPISVVTTGISSRSRKSR